MYSPTPSSSQAAARAKAAAGANTRSSSTFSWRLLHMLVLAAAVAGAAYSFGPSWKEYSSVDLVLAELKHAVSEAAHNPLSQLLRSVFSLSPPSPVPGTGTDDTTPLPDHAILDLLTRNEMDFSKSTTPVPISTHSPLMKSLLAGDLHHLPAPLWHLTQPGGVQSTLVRPVRDHVNALRYSQLVDLCTPAPRCTRAATFRDPVFGLTPLHVALAQGDTRAAQLLRNLGASDTVLDEAGRAPGNLSFTHFVRNARKWAKNPGECTFPTVDASDPKDMQANFGRLILEGEPVMLRNFMPTFAPDVWDEYKDLDTLVAKHGHAQVRFGTVPYADYFGLETGVTTLADFYATHVKPAGDSKQPGRAPQYVFQKHSDLTLALLPVLEYLALTHFPRLPHDGGRLICPPSFAGTGNASIHYFVGAPGSGAPFHIHADAVNVNLFGTKVWYVAPPLDAPYSRVPVHEWMKQVAQQSKDGNVASEVERKMHPDNVLTCTQRAGDLVYVPFDWSHAVVNKETNLGVALELLNRRDAFVGWEWGERFIQC